MKPPPAPSESGSPAAPSSPFPRPGAPRGQKRRGPGRAFAIPAGVGGEAIGRRDQGPDLLLAGGARPELGEGEEEETETPREVEVVRGDFVLGSARGFFGDRDLDVEGTRDFFFLFSLSLLSFSFPLFFPLSLF